MHGQRNIKICNVQMFSLNIVLKYLHTYAPIITKKIKYSGVCRAWQIKMEEKWNVYKILRKEPFAKPPFGKSRRMKDMVKMDLGDIICVLGTGSAYYSNISVV